MSELVADVAMLFAGCIFVFVVITLNLALFIAAAWNVVTLAASGMEAGSVVWPMLWAVALLVQFVFALMFAAID